MINNPDRGIRINFFELFSGSKSVRNEWHLKLLQTFPGEKDKLIWTKKASLAVKVSVESTRIGKEARLFQSFRAAVAAAREQKDLYFASLLSQESILEAFGSARSDWHGRMGTDGCRHPPSRFGFFCRNA